MPRWGRSWRSGLLKATGVRLVTRIVGGYKDVTMSSQADLDRFYENLIASIRASGGVCAITSGMACVLYHVAQSTKDCDVLCSEAAVGPFLSQLAQTTLDGATCSYRGHITPPLDARWLKGGWTSHFEWKAADITAYLDVFGVAPRASSPWVTELNGRLAGMHTVAEMKRTDRLKDWPFATALGVKMIEAGDLRGWLHLFDATTLRQTKDTAPCPEEIRRARPLLTLLDEDSPRLQAAVFAEMVYWQQLDHIRMRVYEAAVRQYFMAVKKDAAADVPDFLTQHRTRVGHAEALLPQSPLRDYGIDRLIAEARVATLPVVASGALDWLPDIATHFVGLE